MMMMMLSVAFTQRHLQDENKDKVNQLQCIQLFILKLMYFLCPVVLMVKMKCQQGIWAFMSSYLYVSRPNKYFSLISHYPGAAWEIAFFLVATPQ